MEDYKEFYALRSGDLRPEKVSTLGFTEEFAEELKHQGLLFETFQEAKSAREYKQVTYGCFHTHKLSVDDEGRIYLTTPKGMICSDGTHIAEVEDMIYAIVDEANVKRLLALDNKGPLCLNIRKLERERDLSNDAAKSAKVWAYIACAISIVLSLLNIMSLIKNVG